MRTLILCLLCLTLAPSLNAQTFQSGDVQVPLLELYTSEGCSSCPPADRWLTDLLDSPGLWTRFVPVALHVDYWNYLGWDDRFSDPEFARRQRDYRRQGYISAVYTPGVILGGEEWRNWRQGTKPLKAAREPVGELELALSNPTFEASFTPANEPTIREPVLHIALVGFDLKTEVRAGENRGRELRHDFVVLAKETFSGTKLLWNGRLPMPTSDHNPSRIAVAAWISDGNDPRPIQAVGGWLSP